MGFLGNSSSQPADPSYHLPPKNLGANCQDFALFASISSACNVIIALIIFGICALLALHFAKTPTVLTQEEGLSFYRTSKVLFLDEEMVENFARITTESLLSYRSPEQDFSWLEGLVTPQTIEKFNAHAKKQAEARAQSQRRQFWEIKEIRRYYNSALPNYIGLAIKGKKTIFQKSADLSASEPDKYESEVLVIVYLKQQTPTYRNPWGLVLDGIQEHTSVDKINAFWDQSVKLSGTMDFNNNFIQTPRKEYLPTPIFEKIKFYNWFKDIEIKE